MRHTWLRWRTERKRKEEKGIDHREGRGQTGRTRESCFSSPWRPQTTSRKIEKNSTEKKIEKERPKESSVSFQVTYKTNFHSWVTVI